jgi:hypothetical protein
MVATWMLRGFHLFMGFVLYVGWWAQISDISTRTHGFPTRQMNIGEIVGLTIVLLVVLTVWKMGAKIIKSFR